MVRVRVRLGYMLGACNTKSLPNVKGLWGPPTMLVQLPSAAAKGFYKVTQFRASVMTISCSTNHWIMTAGQLASSCNTTCVLTRVCPYMAKILPLLTMLLMEQDARIH